MHIKALIGLAERIERTHGAPCGYARIRLSDRDRGAMAIAVPHARRMTLADYDERAFHDILCEARERADALRAYACAELRARGIAVELPQTAQTSEATLEAPVSFKHVAVRAGLGWIGRNGVLVTPRYGPMVSLTALLLDARVPEGTAVTASGCPEDCHACASACPHGAIKGATWEEHGKRFELIDYHLCNQKRTLHMLQHDRKHACGYCMVACPVGRRAAR